eukprot:UN11332
MNIQSPSGFDHNNYDFSRSRFKCPRCTKIKWKVVGDIEEGCRRNGDAYGRTAYMCTLCFYIYQAGWEP